MLRLHHSAKPSLYVWTYWILGVTFNQSPPAAWCGGTGETAQCDGTGETAQCGGTSETAYCGGTGETAVWWYR